MFFRVVISFRVFQDIDYILWTGDLPPHDVWNQTKEENLKVLQETVAQMSDMFPGVPIFPALGNHESSPVNRYVTIIFIHGSRIFLKFTY